MFVKGRLRVGGGGQQYEEFLLQIDPSHVIFDKTRGNA